MPGPDFEALLAAGFLPEADIRKPIQDWSDPADPGTWDTVQYGTESQTRAAEVEPPVLDPRVVEGLASAAHDAHLFLPTDTREMSVIALNEHGQPITQPIPIVTQDQM